MKERAVRFGTNGSLIGVVTDPPSSDDTVGETARRPAIILLGAGLVHHVGPHRLYVKLARQLASQGFVVLRFDFSGIGDSAAPRDDLPLEEAAVAETRDAMDWLRDARHVDQFVLMAICSGAGFSFRAACADPRVVSIALINAAGHRWGTSAERGRTLARHYVRMLSARSFRWNNWRKVVTLNFAHRGMARAAVTQLTQRLTNREPTPEGPPAAGGIAMAFDTLVARGVRVLIVYSEGDEGWDYYQLYLRRRLGALVSAKQVELAVVEGANHTFTLLSHQQQLLALLGGWLERAHA
ncbi:MAG: alpha/beta fold hydrolase [Gemmatimonadaceae bacterium]